MDIISRLQEEVAKKYDDTINKDIIFDSSCIRWGKDGHGWLYANEWDYKGNTYQEISYGSWRSGDKGSIKSWDKSLYKDKKFNKAYKTKTREARAKVELDTQKKQKACREKWLPVYKKSKQCTSHDYLEFKGVKPSSLLKIDYNGVLLLPVYGINGFTGLQRIFKDPETGRFIKKYTSGIKISGSILPIMPLKGHDFCYLAEGYATAATVQELYPDIPVVCCFSANNIANAIETIRFKYPEIKICIAADNDHATHKPIKNTGLFYARKAAKRYPKTVYRYPKFAIKNDDWTDFNDMAQFESKDKVIEQLFVDPDEFSFIQPLGHNEGTYFYLSSENQQIVTMGWNGHVKQGLRRLISNDSYWLKNYGIQGEDDTIKISWDAASSHLMGECHEKGIFDPSRVRGIGVWKDGKNYVINDGEKIHNANEGSKFQYQKTIPVDYALTPDPDHEAMTHLLEAFKNLECKNQADYFYMASWLVQAQIFSILPWRFHIWVTGSAGTGKSTILQWLHSLSVNSILTNNTSGAGIRQTAKSNAVSVIFDEAEATTTKTKETIELAREMSSNGDYQTLRGTVSGNALNYNTQCIFCFGSIQVHELNQADKSRIFMVELNSIKNQSEEDFANISERFNYFSRNKGDFFTIVYNNIDNILWNINFCKSLLKSSSKLESRLADQLSVAIACFFVYWGQRKMDRDDFDIIVKHYGLIESDYATQNSEKEHDSCYDLLMSTIIDNYSQTTVAEAIHNIRYKGDQSGEFERFMGTHGLRYYPDEESLFVQSKNGNIKGKLKDYPDLARVLKRDKNIILKDSDRVRITQLGYVRGIKIKLKT